MQRLYILPVVFLLFCASALPQTTGTIQCDPGTMTSVPAWIAPGKPHVVQQLECGQSVSVLGMGHFFTVLGYSSRPREYAKIQIGEQPAYVDARFIKLSDKPQAPAVKQSPEIVPENDIKAEEEEQRRWSTITKDHLSLRDESLLRPVALNGPRTFHATLNNSSKFAVSHLHLLMRLYDCSGKPEKDHSNCEIIGEARPIVAASVPPGQTRRITGYPLFEATPRVRGKFSWGYEILGVRVE